MLLSELVERKDEITQIVRRNKGDHIRIFGSTVNNNSTVDSDIDFLIKFNDGASLFDLIEIKLELEELLGSKVDVVSENGLKDNEVGNSIKRSAVAI